MEGGNWKLVEVCLWIILPVLQDAFVVQTPDNGHQPQYGSFRAAHEEQEVAAPQS
jgi:hypothetical protein